MSYTVVLSSMPTRLTAGESVSWKWTSSTFPASSWTLTYTLVSGSRQIQIVATASGSEHLVEVPGATTGQYAAGEYSWQSHVSDGDERYMVDEGIIEVVPDFATRSSGIDTRSHVRRVLDSLEAAIEGRAGKTQLEQTVGGVQIQHMTLSEQIANRDRYKIKHQKELAAKGQGASRRTIKPRFAN